ncbi:His/Gly/Thr/Pro-type tRNA ligase C-terminal domain-containing protein [Phycicoccus flavus]|uniref:His/Gly/Thr/Pro-type tRNA ligase C-terminal domain-containing protein n=1 Tax=Phycicoccus flavus TaxID=2502783 RepID=UPI000FEBBFB2|nr:His/Gly/Thr/Pro-type tRNA ligase C-terminal domain-containing protein [Phycicoccus flavus]NHA68422.1 glycine--tRNA ligase [Phycicoccus flavus]
MAPRPSRLDTVVDLATRRGFVLPSGGVHGGAGSGWDHGPLGVELKENIRRQWWRAVVTAREDVVGLDTSVVLPRATPLDAVEDGSEPPHLRPELAQGAFAAFPTVARVARRTPPFGIAQTGRTFRAGTTPDEVLPTREPEQMAVEFFVEPGEVEDWHRHWVHERTRWYTDLGLRRENLRHVEPRRDGLPDPPGRRVDIEYRVEGAGGGWDVLEGIGDRADAELAYLDPASGRSFTPAVIEAAADLSRVLVAVLVDAHGQDEAPNTKGGVDRRTVLRLDPRLAPVKAAVLPLSRNADLSPKARDLAATLRRHWNIEVDDAGAIGRRYRRQDEIGTPFCVTVDFDTLDDGAVTVRERDAMRQVRIGFDAVEGYLAQRLAGC